jgi:hypothetical protein
MEAMQCPWCKRWCLKDNACNYIFACGLDDKGKFHIGSGCGRSWCFKCGLKFCGQYYDEKTGQKTPLAKDMHNIDCCKTEESFKESEFCGGGHNSHCEKRW